MIHALSRELRVRDDGTGQPRDSNGTFAEFESESAIILLGDPGMGKTTFFREAAQSTYSTVRKFLLERPAPTGNALFLDALDEYRTITSGNDASAEVAKALCELKKPKFRLACRAADWFGSLDQEVLRVASASGRLVVLELRPLTRDEILTAVQDSVLDPPQFLADAESAGLRTLLGNPQTLELLARAWGTGQKPRNKFDTYDIGVSELLREMNTLHVSHRVTSPHPRDLRKAAGAAASTILLSNTLGVSRAEPADGNGYGKVSIVPHPNDNDLDAVLRRRLFISTEVDRFEMIHRTIAEFLAAEDLSNRIMNGLPIDRVMALICGIDGKPISSLRGLFAWLMCRLGNLADRYVERDPYGVATYADATALLPNAQCALWSGLRKLRDPWFLTNEDDRGSFRGLANRNTATIIREILEDPGTGVHLKIAALEAIANSTENIGIDALLREMVVVKHGNTWLRSRALKAFGNSVKNDWPILDKVDQELTQAFDDFVAPEVRATLFCLTRGFGCLPVRVLSILEQDASIIKERGVIGRLHSLIDLPSETDLDVILDGMSGIPASKGRPNFEISFLFDHWFKRRLENPSSITAARLTSWLQTMRGIRERRTDTILTALKARFRGDPALFENVFQLLATGQTETRSFIFFIADDLWQLLPATVWPLPQYEFFLGQAEKERDTSRAAEFFRMYLSWFPTEGASVALTEAGFDLLDRRHDVAKALGSWNICKIEEWRIDHSTEFEEESRERSEDRARIIAYLTPRLTTIRQGGEENALVWGTAVYQGLFYDVEDSGDPRDRLIGATNEEIADALIEGFIRYTENQTIPKMEAVIQSWCANSIPYAHILLSLSAFLRLRAGMTIPASALANCIAAVVTNVNCEYGVPGWHEMLSKWILQEVNRNPSVVRAVLKDIWVASAAIKRRDLPGFYELKADANCQQFLASLSAGVLETGIHDDHYTVGKLVSVLLLHDRQVAMKIGETELLGTELSTEVRAKWTTAMFAIDPLKYLEPWKTVMAGPDEALWEAIDVIGRSAQHGNKGPLSLTSAQRAEVVASLGRRFPNVGPPMGGWSGSQNPWDASEFVANQIKLLAADGSSDTDAELQRLENDDSLASYHDMIRHQRAQHQKRQRESSFAFASPEQVAEAISNHSPATPNDLLAFIVDHLNALSHELNGTQRERYRAYWNESGRILVKPKHEEACSGFLADDLLNRIKTHNLNVVVEHHMVADKECDLVVLQSPDRLLPIEAKHHYNPEIWTAWRTQLDRLYSKDAKAGGLGIYLVFWSGIANGRTIPKPPDGIERPTAAAELKSALESLIPDVERHRLRVVLVDISPPLLEAGSRNHSRKRTPSRKDKGQKQKRSK